VRAGDLRRRVLFQKRVSTKDTFGQETLAWIDYLGNVPADIQALSGREQMAAQAVNASVSHSISVRYSSLLADPIAVAAMRVIYINAGVTRYFNVASAMNVDERNKTISLTASEGLNQQ
jgi:SPP1 family predicted phage head-tail adaptor